MVMDLYIIKTFFIGLIYGGGKGRGYFWRELLPGVKTERKIC